MHSIIEPAHSRRMASDKPSCLREFFKRFPRHDCLSEKQMLRRYQKYLLTFLLLIGSIGLINLSGCANSPFYYPDNRDYGASPAASGLKYERVEFTSRDGTRLSGWFVPNSQTSNPRNAVGTVIQVHGNAGNMTAHWPLVDWLPARGFNVFVFDYRGYGASTGEPGPRGLYDDTQSAIDYVRARPDIDPQRLLILGQSLGGNNAIAAVGGGDRDGIRAVAIDSTFYSYSSIANDKIPGVGILANNQYSANRYVASLQPIPLLFIHCTGDRVIPSQHSERLFAAAAQPKQLILIPGCNHLDAFSSRFGNQYRDNLVDFYQSALGATSPVPAPNPGNISPPG